jgi:Fur family peroxide stress response transcriptional regulator
MRKTRQKAAILEVLKGTTSHPTADWIYNEVRKKIPNISLGTVYRNLRQLCRSGEILELELCGSFSRFDARNDNHYHFRCERCGQVFDVDEPINSEMDKTTARRTGFRINYHRLEFYGLCLDCQLVEAVGEK